MAPPTRERHRYRSNLTPAPAGSTPVSNPTPSGCGRAKRLPAPGSRQEGAGAQGARVRVSRGLLRARLRDSGDWSEPPAE